MRLHCDHSRLQGNLGEMDLPLILLILKPGRICVGSRRCVRLRTMSMKSCVVGTGAISFQVVLMIAELGGVRFSNVWIV